MTDPTVALARIRRLARSGIARERRQRAHLSLADMAAPPVDVSVSTLYRWEVGQRVPHGDAALRYLDRLEALGEEL